MSTSRLQDWFLTVSERGNPTTAIDRRRGNGRAWTEGNYVEVLVDGAEYFRHLHAALTCLGPGDAVELTDWQGDGDEMLVGPGTEIGRVLADAARRGVDVRGLLWRSHPRQAHFAEQDNASMAKTIDTAGGEVVLDERVRIGGSHHQKLVVLRTRSGALPDVAFAGGIDLCHGRRDDAQHNGDCQPVELDERFGSRPPWHDVQLEVRGPAVDDLEHTFRERWQDPTPLDHNNPLRIALRRFTRQPRHPNPLPDDADDRNQPIAGTHAVQVIRTYPAKRSPYPFAPEGERSIARAYLKAFRRARRLVYLEDQYLWSIHAAHALADGLRRTRELHVVAVVPRFPDRAGRATGAANRIGRERVTDILRRAGGDRVAIYDLENEAGTPVYVHAKVCVIDDVLLVAGSDNLNRRSWTHDSELSCSVIDERLDEREPRDPGGLGDGARRLARDTRLRLWREHLGRRDTDDDVDLLDPTGGYRALEAAADALDRWHAGGRVGPRPPGHLRRHQPERVGRWARGPALVLHRYLLDPDGRPRSLRRSDSF
ncbi:MAG TPA: phospholipase D-like domain-containing protein [Acidimicrobiia bacterium]|nr:phospholipase D-like domain-containing protein [Acidimicrobiia bacterium]